MVSSVKNIDRGMEGVDELWLRWFRIEGFGLVYLHEGRAGGLF